MISIRALTISLLLAPLIAEAGARRFNYVYEATTGAPGSVDFENWITFAAHTPNDHGYRALEFRHEIEIGITENFQVSIYLADWDYQRHAGTRYESSALELIYNFTNPIIDPVALSVYQEYRAGPDVFEWESKVIAQKNIGRWVGAYNATLEANWQGHDWSEREGEFQQALGISYELRARVAVGIEMTHEVEFPDWSTKGRGKFFAGPNVSIRGANWFTTITALAQVTRDGDEPDLQLRTIFGLMF